MNAHPTAELVQPAGRMARSAPQRPVLFPRQGVAAALVVDRAGSERVEPVIVIDFYREADLP